MIDVSERPARAAEGTGSGDFATRNDVAFAIRAGRAPIAIAVYFTGSSASYDAQSTILAAVGRIVGAAFA